MIPSDWQVAACRAVCGYYDDPVGEPSDLREIIEHAAQGTDWCNVAGVPAPEDPQAEVEALIEHGYLAVFRYKSPDLLGVEAPGVYEPTDKARALYPEKYPEYATETVEECDCGVRVDAAADRLMLPNEPQACPTCGGSYFTKLHFGEGNSARGCGKTHSYWHRNGTWHCHQCGKFVRPS